MSSPEPHAPMAHAHGALAHVLPARVLLAYVEGWLRQRGCPRARLTYRSDRGTPAAMERVLSLGSIVSFTGILTFKNGQNIRDTLAATPMGSFMLETDSPYLAPVPHRGKRCEPAYVKEIAETAAQGKALWRMRESIPDAAKVEGLVYRHDIAVAVSRIPEFINTASAALEAAYPGVRIICFGHLGDGNLHFNAFVPGRERSDEVQHRGRVGHREPGGLVDRHHHEQARGQAHQRVGAEAGRPAQAPVVGLSTLPAAA